MNQEKGYDGGFAWGFFLGIIGIIVVAVRPYNKTQSAPSRLEPKSNNSTYSYKKTERTMYYCSNCYNTVSDDEDLPFHVCQNCGNPLENSNISESKWESMTENEKNQTKEKWFGIKNKQDFEKELKDRFTEIGLEKYIPLFEKNDILDPAVARSINETDLKEIGIDSLGDRKRIIDIIESIFSFSVKTKEKQQKDEEDWICPKCAHRNKSFFTKCYKCSTDKPKSDN